MDSSYEKQVSWFQEEWSGLFLTLVTDLDPQTQAETGEPSSAFQLPLSLPGPSGEERDRPHGEEGFQSDCSKQGSALAGAGGATSLRGGSLCKERQHLPRRCSSAQAARELPLCPHPRGASWVWSAFCPERPETAASSPITWVARGFPAG